MLKHFFILCLLALAFQIEANVDHQFKSRVAWVKQIKLFIQDVEQKNPKYFTTDAGINLKKYFNFINEAFAADGHECFFAGWPSTLVKSSGKKYCQNPIKGNSEYLNGSCGTGQLQCQPLLFGEGLCVGFSSSQDKQLAFSKCESKFKLNPKYDYLKVLTPEQKNSLKEISVLAQDICVSGSVGIQKSKAMCKNLLNKMQEAMSAIESAPEPDQEKSDKTETIDNEQVEEALPEGITTSSEVVKTDIVATVPVNANADVKSVDASVKLPTDEICEIPVDKKVEKTADMMIKTVNSGPNALYDEIKNEFLNSPLCAPENVMGDPKERLNPILFKQLQDDLMFIVKTDSYLTKDVKLSQFKELCSQYSISEDTLQFGEQLLKNIEDNSQSRFNAMARIRGLMFQDMAKNAKGNPDFQSDIIKEGLAERGVFKYTVEGEVECPFVAPEAFKEALQGREAVLRSGKKSLIKDPDILTIVDYSRPSNERRMFVIDLKNKKVLHNTWVAHGGGNDRSQGQGVDGKGSSPQTSNASGTNLSSEGFYVATTASHGASYLDNVVLQGIDSNNSNMGSRAIVVHGWRTPNSSYLTKTWEMTERAPYTRLPGKDIYNDFMSIDFKTTTKDLFDATSDLSSAASAKPYMDATDGCLGVPETNVGHVDRKGRNKTQLELFREDLPGTLMFNYVGPGKTKSKYLN